MVCWRVSSSPVITPDFSLVYAGAAMATAAGAARASSERSGTRRWGAESMLMPRATVAAKARGKAAFSA